MRRSASTRRLGTVLAFLVVLVAVAGAAVASGAWRPFRGGPVPPRYVDETAASSLAFTYDGPFDFAVGGGVAVFDCDADGKPDLYLAGGAKPAGLFHNDSPVGGSLRFSRRPDAATDLTAVTGAYPIDVDGDGNVDLVVLRIGGNVVLRGLGGCRFAPANEAWGLAGGRFHTMAFAATWENRQAWPTLAFGNYVDQSIQDVSQWCEPNQLVRPDATGTAWVAPIDLKGWCTQSLLFSDWDGSGRRDLRVSNDRHYYRTTDGEEQLWRIEPGQQPREYGPADGWQVVQVEGMGIASYDVTGDGRPEVYLTSQAANRLQTLATGAGPGQPTYADIGGARGVNVAHPFIGDVNLPSTSWHPEFQDVNDDGLMDLLVTKGSVAGEPDFANKDPGDLLLGQADGTFVEAAGDAGLVRFDRGRGAALADFNLDGRLDLVEVFYGTPAVVWRNAGLIDGTAGHWLALRLQDDGPNRDAIGANLEVRFGSQVVRREITIGGGHAGGQLGWIHVGLGDATTAQVRVQWPDGEWGPVEVVSGDSFDLIRRGTDRPIPWTSGG